MQYWLIKSEPDAWSWDNQVKESINVGWSQKLSSTQQFKKNEKR